MSPLIGELSEPEIEQSIPGSIHILFALDCSPPSPRLPLAQRDNIASTSVRLLELERASARCLFRDSTVPTQGRDSLRIA